MKKIIISFISAIFCLVIFAQVSKLQETNNIQEVKDEFDKMSFEVGLNKDTYLPLEPLFAKFKFFNQTGASITTFTPDFLREAKIRISLKGKVTEVDGLSSISGTPFRLPAIFKPNKSYEKDEILNTRLNDFFPECGNYQIQFILYNEDRSKTIESNLIDIKVEEPTGINKEAFKFLRKHEKYATLFSWVQQESNGEKLLETFVNKYGESVYGEYAIYQLGLVYRSHKELEKARVEFEKIKFSKNTIIATEANRALEEIAERKANSEKY